MALKRVVIDTNVILSALKSRKGSSYSLLERLAEDAFEIAISVPLILEYELVLKLHLDRSVFSDEDIEDFINYLCKIGIGTEIFYLWRPILSDSNDDHILEVAVASQSQNIITFNLKDFYETKKFGIEAMRPKDFILKLGER